MWHIVNGWGDVGTRILEQHRKILQQNRHDGLADDSKEVLGESFTLTGTDLGGGSLPDAIPGDARSAIAP